MAKIKCPVCAKGNNEFSKTKKNNFHYHCYTCGSTYFCKDKKYFPCEHPLSKFKLCKNKKYIYINCHICRVTGFIPIEMWSNFKNIKQEELKDMRKKNLEETNKMLNKLKSSY